LIKLPNFKKSFEYENDFYLSCDVSRLGKLLGQYELFKMVKDIPGEIVECGVFKGASLCRFAIFRELFGNSIKKKIIAFDTFGKFPKAKFTKDIQTRNNWLKIVGNKSISKQQLMKILKHKKTHKLVELVKGDIVKTVPLYVKSHPNLKISFLNLDTDLYEPSLTVLNFLYPKIVKGGILLLDDYNFFPGETKAVNEYFKNKNIKLKPFPFIDSKLYIVK